LTPKNVLEGIEGSNQVPPRHIFEKRVIGMPPLELCLVEMMMSADEARADDLALLVEDLRDIKLSLTRVDVRIDLYNGLPFSKDIHTSRL
jgi:hypothetical protein